MNRLVILLTDATTTSANELLESLRSAGISVSLKDFADLPSKVTPASGNDRGPTPARPLAVLYEVGPEAAVDRLRLVFLFPARFVTASCVALLLCWHRFISRQTKEKQPMQHWPALRD